MEHRNFYGRIKGKALNAAQERYLEEDLPKLSVGGISRTDNPERSLLDMQQSRRASRSGWKLASAAASIWCIRPWPILTFSFLA